MAAVSLGAVLVPFAVSAADAGSGGHQVLSVASSRAGSVAPAIQSATTVSSSVASPDTTASTVTQPPTTVPNGPVATTTIPVPTTKPVSAVTGARPTTTTLAPTTTTSAPTTTLSPYPACSESSWGGSFTASTTTVAVGSPVVFTDTYLNPGAECAAAQSTICPPFSSLAAVHGEGNVVWTYVPPEATRQGAGYSISCNQPVPNPMPTTTPTTTSGASLSGEAAAHAAG